MGWEGTANPRPVAAVTAFLAIPFPSSTKTHQLLPFPHTLRNLSTFNPPIGQHPSTKTHFLNQVVDISQVN